jgi:hypothetical protein
MRLFHAPFFQHGRRSLRRALLVFAADDPSMVKALSAVM